MKIDNTSMNNEERAGRFTSSMVYKLIPKGKVKMTKEELKVYREQNPGSRITTKEAGFQQAGETYIREKIYEKRFKSCLDSDAYSPQMAWGNLMEMYVYSILGLEYEISSKATELHPKYGDFWAGSSDMKVTSGGKVSVISEIKCYWKKAFAEYVDCILQEDVAKFRDEFPKEYWQIVSNACINDADYGEAVCFMPYESEHPEIIDIIDGFEGEDLWKYRFVAERSIKALPFLPDDGYYQNVNKFRFKIPLADKMLLTTRLIEANEVLKSNDKV